MIVFISSPYTHSSEEVMWKRFELTSKIVAKIVSTGVVAISPVIYGHTLSQYEEMPLDWEFWKNYCESFLIKSDKVLVLMIDGWLESTGVKAEIEFANKNGIPVEYIEVDEDLHEKNTGWISIDDAEPSVNGFYNVKLDTDAGNIIHSCWFEDGEWKYDNYLISGEQLYAMGWYASVTHWIPLPK